MATEMLDRLQENKVRGLEEFLDSWNAVPAPGREDQAGEIADVMVDEGIGIRQGLLRLWECHWTMALAGDIPKLKEHGASLRTLLERGGRALTRGAKLARTYAQLSGLEVARLAQFEEHAKAFPLWIEERMACWDLLSRPRKPLDREAIARAHAAYERGECEDVADILARLKQGGPLVKE